ncbi:Peptidase family M48 [Nitrosospira multiformis]|uniref:Peptidase family M48 n=1 Tax=Nitrosospira multiformis TaxID=1231 RepID=A0A1H8HF03_9PROT|nr:M48 family metallopeptidase [Nitrosospira multiformis]SEN54851.1 Peptidase family M48 [Nitrosospira multiformis]
MSTLSTFRLLIALSISAWLAALAGCATTTAGGAVGVNSRDIVLISSKELEQKAAQGYEQLKTEAAQKGTLNTEEKLLQRVRAIARRIEPQTSIFRKDAPSWNWEVNVIDSNELNAFCMPGGKIMFYSSLINRLELTDEEIAVVMGHEVAHALREDTREHVSRAIATQTLLNAITPFIGGETAGNLAGIGYQAFIETRFSRTDEADADKIGLELSARAGYDPRAGITLWQKMISVRSSGQLPEFLSSHPADANRIQQVEKLLPVVMPLYEAAPH